LRGLFLLKAPCIDIVCYSSHHPYRQEWDDSGGHQILFRVDIVMIVMLTPRPCRFERSEAVERLERLERTAARERSD